MREMDVATRHLVLSAIGAVAVLAVCWLGASTKATVQPGDRLIVGVMLVACYGFGLSLAIRPGWVRMLRRDAAHGINTRHGVNPRRRIGHHPDCDRFDGHRVRLGRRILCAGCTGLAAGSIASIIAACLYMAIPTTVPLILAVFMVYFGTALMAAYFNDVERFVVKRGARLFDNAALSASFLLVSLGLLEATGNPVYGLIGTVVSALWLDTRIRMSVRRHANICMNCIEACKSYGA